MKRRLSLATLFAFLMLMPAVSAQVGGALENTFNIVFDILEGIIKPLVGIDFIENNFLFLRLLVFVFLVIAIPAFLKKTPIFKDENYKNVATIIGVVVALIGSIGMPNGFLDVIYGILTVGTGSVIVALIAIFLAYLIYRHDTTTAYGYGIKSGLALVLLLLLVSVFAKLQTASLFVQTMMGLTILLFFIMFITYLIYTSNNMKREAALAAPPVASLAIAAPSTNVSPKPGVRERFKEWKRKRRELLDQVSAFVGQSVRGLDEIVEKITQLIGYLRRIKTEVRDLPKGDIIGLLENARDRLRIIKDERIRDLNARVLEEDINLRFNIEYLNTAIRALEDSIVKVQKYRKLKSHKGQIDKIMSDLQKVINNAGRARENIQSVTTVAKEQIEEQSKQMEREEVIQQEREVRRTVAPPVGQSMPPNEEFERQQETQRYHQWIEKFEDGIRKYIIYIKKHQSNWLEDTPHDIYAIYYLRYQGFDGNDTQGIIKDIIKKTGLNERIIKKRILELMAPMLDNLKSTKKQKTKLDKGIKECVTFIKNNEEDFSNMDKINYIISYLIRNYGFSSYEDILRKNKLKPKELRDKIVNTLRGARIRI